MEDERNIAPLRRSKARRLSRLQIPSSDGLDNEEEPPAIAPPSSSFLSPAAGLKSTSPTRSPASASRGRAFSFTQLLSPSSPRDETSTSASLARLAAAVSAAGPDDLHEGYDDMDYSASQPPPSPRRPAHRSPRAPPMATAGGRGRFECRKLLLHLLESADALVVNATVFSSAYVAKQAHGKSKGVESDNEDDRERDPHVAAPRAGKSVVEDVFELLSQVGAW